VTPEGVLAMGGLLGGGRILAATADRAVALYSLHGGPVQPLPWRQPSLAEFLRVSGDGRSVFVREGNVPVRLDQMDVLTGRRTPWRILGAQAQAGVSWTSTLCITPDGRTYAYGYGLYLQDIYLVEGLKF